jgi:hypothetical protein
MLTRNNQVAPQQEYYADSLLTMPSTTRSVYDNLVMGFATPVIALNMLDKQFAQKPEGQAVVGSYNALQLENETPGMGWAQHYANEGANMLGFGLNPATWALGGAGGLATRGLGEAAEKVAPDALTSFMRTPIKELVSKPIGEYIPSMIGKEGAEEPLSLGLMADKTLHNFGTFAGAGVPQGIVDNYNQDTGNIAWGGVAREMGEMGAFGIAIGSVPFAFGVLRGKINRGLGDEQTADITTQKLNDALERGQITPAEHQWYMDYLEHQQTPEDVDKMQGLQDRATQIINDNGHTANEATNEAMFEMLSPDDMKNLQGVIADQISGDVPEEYKKALSDFVIHNRLDNMREDPRMLDGVRGYVDFINKKLEAKPEKIAEADQILDDHMLKGVKENMPFSQKEIMRYMKKAGFESSHMKQLPVTIPDNMTQNLKLNEKISYLNNKLKIAKRNGAPENIQTVRRIEQLQNKQPKILTPKEELTHIRKTLLTEKGLPDNWQMSNAYHRLLDLSNVWANARTLLDRIHLEHEYEKQEAFRDLTNNILKISDADLPKIAKPENVIDYLRRRIEGNLTKSEPIADIQRAVDDRQNVPADSDSILNEQQEQIKNTEAEDAKNEFVQSTEKFKEFKESDGIFKNLISCVMGGLRGQG